MHAFASRFDAAERAYEEVGGAIGRTGIWFSERGMVFVGAFCMRLMQGRAGEAVDGAAWLHRQWPHVRAAADVHALALAAAGRTTEAARAAEGAGPLRRDFFFDLTMSIRGLRAIALGDRDLAEEVYAALLPYVGHVTGGATAVATFGPVAQVLGDLALFLGRPAEVAAAHYGRAADVAGRLGASLWADRANAAIARLGTPAA